MRQSQLFVKTLREEPKSEKSVSARLLIRAGFIDKLSAGVYIFLPLGFRVLEKIRAVISEEMENIGGQRILMSALIPKENWEQTGRWKIFEELYKVKGSGGQEYALGPTHEEVIVPLLRKHISSYKDLPCYVYQIQTKFRDELRAKSGILRTREFDMKDLYSFHRDEEDLDRYYEKVKAVYLKILKRLGIGKETYLTRASGGTFSKFSEEFQTITPAGENTIYICRNCQFAVNEEIKKDYPRCPQCRKGDFRKEKAIEVGNIFKLGTKYSQPFNLEFTDKDGSQNLVLMGCYGLGPTRLMGTIVEVHHDEAGIVWPSECSPFDVHLIQLGNNRKKKKQAEDIYRRLQEEKLETLYDDRQEQTAGEKFVDADLIGIPLRIVVSGRTLEKDSVEIKKRSEKKTRLIKIKELPQFLNSKILDSAKRRTPRRVANQKSKWPTVRTQ